MLNIQQESTPHAFELDLVVRDSDGQPTGARKTIKTDSPFKLWSFWQRHQGRPKRKKKKRNKNKKETLPTSKEADKILSEMYDDGPSTEQG